METHEHGPACNHEHPAQHAAPSAGSRLRIAIPVTAVVFILEFAGGLWSSSLALLSDSIHVLFDAVALGLSYAAIVLAARPATDRHSYGLHRGEILAALANGAALFLVSLWIFWEAYARLLHPRDVRAVGMLVIAVVGFAANLFVARLLHGHHHDDINVRGAYLHVIGDMLASVGVLIAGVVISTTGWTLIDPILGFAIGLLLLWGAAGLIRESLHILMEGVPRGLTVEEVAAAVGEVPGVAGFHRVHIWSLCSHIRALSAHLTVDTASGYLPESVLAAVNDLLHERYGITHTTLQSECRGCSADNPYCTPVHPASAGAGHRH